MSTIIEIDTSSAIEEVIRLEKEIENYKKLSKQIEDENKELVKGMKELAEQGGSNSEQFKQMNQKLKRLIRAVKYTRLSDVWAEIDYGARTETDKPTIVQRCKERWRRNARP